MGKIVFVINDLSIIGGAEKVCVFWANYISSKNRDVDLELLTTVNSNPIYEIDENIKLASLNFNINEKLVTNSYSAYDKIKTYISDFSLSRILDTYKYFKRLPKNTTVVIHKFEIIRPLYILKKMGLLKDIRFIYFYHGNPESYFNNMGNFMKKTIFNVNDKVILLGSKEGLNIEYKHKKKFIVLNNPVPFTSEKKSELTEKRILVVGRLSEEKGLDKLLEVWSKVNRCDWRLQIVGSGILKDELIGLSEKLRVKESIDFIEQTDDVINYYCNSSIYIMTSISEGMPMVILEAMECGLPIVAFDIRGTNNILKETGILVENLNINEMANQLERLMNNYLLRKKQAEKSLIRIKKYSVECVYNEFINILDK